MLYRAGSSSENNTAIMTAYSADETPGSQAELAIDSSIDTCFNTTTGSVTSLLLTLDRVTSVVGVSMLVNGKMHVDYSLVFSRVVGRL